MNTTLLNFTERADRLVRRLADALEVIAAELRRYNDRQTGVVLDDDDAAIAREVIGWTIEEAQAGRQTPAALGTLADVRDALDGTDAGTAPGAGGKDTVRWAEIRRTPEGLTVTLYEDADHLATPGVVDEAGWTWAEFLDLPEGTVVHSDDTTTLAATGELE